MRVFLGVENGIPWHRTAEAVPGPSGPEDDAAVPTLPAGLLSRLGGLLREPYTPADVARELGHGAGALDVVPAALARALHRGDETRSNAGPSGSAGV